jgi:hypothetical protein
VLLVGFGAIGRVLAPLLRAFGARSGRAPLRGSPPRCVMLLFSIAFDVGVDVNVDVGVDVNVDVGADADVPITSAPPPTMLTAWAALHLHRPFTRSQRPNRASRSVSAFRHGAWGAADRALVDAHGSFEPAHCGAGGPPPPPPPSRTKWTRLVHPSVLTGHVSSLSHRRSGSSGRHGRGGGRADRLLSAHRRHARVRAESPPCDART